MKHSPWNTTRIRFGKAGAHPQLAWESQLPLKPCISLQPLDFKSNCDSSDCFLAVCFISWCSFDLLRKCGLLAHTSAAFLKNCCTEKLFGCLWLVAYSSPSKSSSSHFVSSRHSPMSRLVVVTVNDCIRRISS